MEARIESVTGEPAGEAATTWIVGDDEEVIVIDPGTDAAAVLAAVGQREILAVICTHAHAGHTAAAAAVAERDESPVALHAHDLVLWRETHDDDPDIEMEDEGVFEVAGVALEVLHDSGVELLTRIAGLLLSAIAVQLVIGAVRTIVAQS